MMNSNSPEKQQEMLAPNGKPSNLTPELYAYVRTPEFKEWFGDWELPNKTVDVVPADLNHGFNNFREATKWAIDNIVRTYNNEETGNKGDIRISANAIHKFLSSSAIDKSDNSDIHLAVLKVLPLVIKTSFDAEIHKDYNKGENGIRSINNGFNPSVMIHRLYGAVRTEIDTYRVKVTLKQYKDLSAKTKAYSYEATKIELLEGSLRASMKGTLPRTTNNSIPLAKLLKNIEKSYEKGKKILDHSRILDENGEPRVLYRGQWSHDDVPFVNHGDGIYFTPQREAAIGYGLDENPIPVFLNARKPYEVDFDGDADTEENNYHADVKGEYHYAESEGFDILIATNTWDGENNLDQFVVMHDSQVRRIDTLDLSKYMSNKEMENDNRLSPIMRQFYEMKEKYPNTLMLFRVGDFYETYERDAKNASEILGITLTWKNAAADFNTYKGAMAAFPFHALDTYLPKLIRAGQRCAICDQLEDPKLTKKQNKTIAEMVSPGIASQEKGIKEAPTAPKLNNQNNMPKKAKTVEQEKKDSPKENATQKTAATEQKVKEPETSKKETKAKEEKPAEKKAEAPAEKKETKAEETKQETPKEKAKLSNGQTLDYASVFPMTHIDDKTYGLKAQVDGVQIGTKKLSDEERGMYFDKKVTPAQLVETKFEKELKPEVFAQMKEWSQYKIPKEAGIKEVNTFKGKDDGKDLISMKTADDSWKTKALSEQDVTALKDKVATPKQVAAKNFSEEIAKEVKKHTAVEELKKNTLPEDLKADIDKIRIFPMKSDGESKKQNMGIQVLFKDGATTKTKVMDQYDVSPVLGNSKKGILPSVPRESAVAKYLMPEMKAHAEKKLGQEQKQGPKL